MEFTPYAFIDAVISFLPFYNACEKLSSYWGKARYIERTSLQAYADVRNHEMSLINANLPTTDFRQIFISSLPFGDDAHSEFNRDEFIDAITNPPSTRRRQVLQLNWLDKNELDAVGRFPCGLLIDAVNGNFGIIRIDQVVNYAKELENLFLRIVDHGDVFHWAKNVFRCSLVTVAPSGSRKSLEILEAEQFSNINSEVPPGHDSSSWVKAEVPTSRIVAVRKYEIHGFQGYVRVIYVYASGHLIS
ncbi:hypothetical protein QR680_011872 [Steinernema hermaphroditum]|uniref:Uncharacterized protein n=1 Tax=Steinernema hermaphroditum TaxID=289476 RepID=A0AA39LYT9_9BILA|nr:hypothetical protein QR680_011872 [Steinernema hermaphroditum]